MSYTCNICGNQENNSLFVAREMMFGLRHEFPYFKCAACGCLQIAEIPNDMNVYYPDSYYSFNIKDSKSKSFKSQLADYLLIQAMIFQSGRFSLPGLFAQLYNPNYYKEPISWIDKNKLNATSRVLDVGCGSGELLLLMQKAGFENLHGVDPYLKADLTYDNGVTIYKKSIFEIEGQYDFIMLHHSFEHMDNPQEVIAKLRALLSDTGTLLIRIPVVDSYAWRKYGVDWFQVDAPRHFYLHTVKSISCLARKHNFKVDAIYYDSLAYQFSISEKYLRNITFNEADPFDNVKQKRVFRYKAKELNGLKDGDRACFYLSKK